MPLWPRRNCDHWDFRKLWSSSRAELPWWPCKVLDRRRQVYRGQRKTCRLSKSERSRRTFRGIKTGNQTPSRLVTPCYLQGRWRISTISWRRHSILSTWLGCLTPKSSGRTVVSRRVARPRIEEQGWKMRKIGAGSWRVELESQFSCLLPNRFQFSGRQRFEHRRIARHHQIQCYSCDRVA